ncbi:hypothetical protein ABT300_02040 [Streptomyces sp. NPDC001027]|uniref:hypothetical protein n=1 Tax=Streptomyces sp. NPDC001027 TaxID=3154771 RepID=UPI00331BCC6C
MAALAAVAIGAGSVTASAATTAERSGKTASPSIYIKYLSTQINLAIGRGQDTTVERAGLGAFKALTPENQEKYLDYLNESSVMDALLAEAAEPGGGSTRTTFTSMNGGDVVIETVEEASFTPDPADGGIEPLATRLRKGTWETTYTVKQKVLGVTVTKLSLWVDYYTNGSKVTQSLNAGAGKRNINPGVSISNSPPKHWLSGGVSTAETVWEGSIIFKGFGVSIDKRHRVSANENGFKSGSVKNI